MNIAHYIVFHPKRQKVKVHANALNGNEVIEDWKGYIYVDKINDGNEDPFVFCDPWLYSYCHATQLRRKPNPNNSFLQEGSFILFVEGGKVKKDKVLVIDTVFLVREALNWNGKPRETRKSSVLPNKYQNQFMKETDLWSRHFKFPFLGQHSSVSYTYEAAMWENGLESYSFIPLNESGENVSIPLKNLPGELSEKILDKNHGKYPVSLNDSEIDIICTEIEKCVKTKILKNIMQI